MELSKIIQTINFDNVILSKIYISIFSKIFKLYIDDIKKRIKLKNNYIFLLSSYFLL